MKSLPLPRSTAESELETLVAAAREPEAWSPSEVARVASHLAESGERLAWSSSIQVADIASTGGPGSPSTFASTTCVERPEAHAND